MKELMVILLLASPGFAFDDGESLSEWSERRYRENRQEQRLRDMERKMKELEDEQYQAEQDRIIEKWNQDRKRREQELENIFRRGR